MSDEKISDFPTWAGGIVPPAGQVPFVFGGVNYKASWTQITGPTLGLGTMAYQNSNAVSITGGSVATSALSGTVAIANGGTAASTVPAARVNLLPAYAGNAGKVLALDVTGTDVQWIPAPGTGTVTSVNVSGGTTGLGTTGGPITTAGTITLSGTLNAASGGTGLSTYAIGDIVYASGTAALTRLPDVATGNALLSGGVGIAPSYGKIGLTTHVSGILPPANGGTGTSVALTPGSVVFAGPGGVLSQDNANFFWDNTAKGLGIGSTSLAQFKLRISAPLTGNVTMIGARVDSQIMSDVTTQAMMFYSRPSTQAAAFTLTDLNHFFAVQDPLGAGSVITNQFGFRADATLISAANNFGFYGNIPAGANRWNLYMAGTADNYMAGKLGIGVLPAAGDSLRVNKDMTGDGGTFHYAIRTSGVVQAGVTGTAGYFRTDANVAAGAAPSAVYHYQAVQGTFAGTTGTQVGFGATPTLIGGTINFGFLGEIPAGTNRWNLYMSGTADNFMQGNLGLGVAPLPNTKFRMGGILPPYLGTFAQYLDSTVPSVATTSATVIATSISTQAAAFTCPTLTHFQANQGTFGAGSAVTLHVGFHAAASLTGGGTNIGFSSDIPAGSNRYNFLAGGTAQNVFAGNTRIGSTAAPTVALDVTGSIYASGVVRTGAYTVATLPSAAAVGEGSRAHVSDANSIAFAAVVAGAGGNQVPVYVGAGAWRVG